MITQNRYEWLAGQWITSTVALPSVTSKAHATSPFGQSAVLTGAGSVAAVVVTSQINANRRAHFAFCLCDTAGSVDGKQATVRIWGVKKLGDSEYIAHHLGDVTVTAGTGAVASGSDLLDSAKLPTGGTPGWADTLDITADKFPLPWGADLEHMDDNGVAVLTMRDHGYESFVMAVKCESGTDGVAVFFAQSGAEAE